MRQIGAFLLLFVGVSCSFERYHSGERAEVTIKIPPRYLEERVNVKGSPGSYTTIDCFVLDVNGPGIDPMYDDNNAFATLDLGMNSIWVSRTALAASGATSMSIRVPIGRSRTLRILGVTGTTPITNCAAQTFKGYPNSGALSSPPYPLVFELARATIDVYLAKNVDTVEAADPAADMMPSNLLNAPPRAALLLGNTASDFSEGPPPNSGGFVALTPPGTTGALAGKARMDLVLDIQGLDVRSIRGIQVQVQAEGGAVTCGAVGTPTINTPSDLVLGMWNEGSFAWTLKNAFIPSGDQASLHTANFSPFNFSTVKTPVTDGSGTFDAIYMSLRVQATPGSGCSAINLTGVTATLFQ